MRIDLEKFREYVKQGYINEIRHTGSMLTLWNYTQHAQFENFWPEEVMMARGLITDPYGSVIARPFKKFFNLNQNEESNMANLVGHGVPKIYEKLDGSLGIQYEYNGLPTIATRGAFGSEQAQWATEWIRKHTDGSAFLPRHTYLYEIIYPENRIVVDYGKRQELVLLAVVHTDSGVELDIQEEAKRLNLSYAKPFDGSVEGMVKYATQMDGNEEGFVLVYPDGFRVKIKGAEYVRLHRLITGFSSKSIWELLMNDQSLDEIIEKVPDEFFDWVKSTEKNLRDEHKKIYTTVVNVAATLVDLPDRKSKAVKIMAEHANISGLLFGFLDGRDIDREIWKRLKPTYELPFKKDIDS